MNLDSVIEHYVIAALWSSVDDEGNPLDDNYGSEDLAEETDEKVRKDCLAMITMAKNCDLLESYPDTEEQFGHDFWLTREGHGAGFWDRGYGNLGERLTALCKTFGSADWYVGDDGQIYQMAEATEVKDGR